MDRDHSFSVDGITINNQLILSAFETARQQNKTREALAETFRLLNLSKLYEVNPTDPTTKQMIKSIVNAKFMAPLEQFDPAPYQIDLSEVFPLNKLGNFGRELERKCRLSEQGVMEFEEGKQPKLKEMKTFANRVEVYGDNQNDNKIGWIGEHKKYGYRLVIVDKSDGHKGIYFTNPERAEQMRLFLAQKFKAKTNYPQLTAKLNTRFTECYLEAFRSKLVNRHKMLSKSNRYSRNVNPKEPDRVIEKSRNDPNTSVFFNESASRSQRGLSDFSNVRDPEDKEMFKLDGTLQTQMRPKPQPKINFQPLENAYMRDLLASWHEKARQKHRSPANSRIIGSVGGRQNGGKMKEESPRGDPLFDRVSKKQESVFGKDRDSSFKVGINASTIKEKSGAKEKESFVKELSEDFDLGEELTCHSIEFLTLNSLFFKPIVTIELHRNNRTEQSIIYNTAIRKKEPHLTYELIPSDHQSLRLNANLRDYDMVVRVVDFLANEEVLTDKISLQTKKVHERTSLTSDNKSLKLDVGIVKYELIETAKQEGDTIGQLKVGRLEPAIREKIGAYWEKESQSQGYYNQTNLSLYRMLSQVESTPLSWWKGLSQDDYELMHVINTSSKVLGFRMTRSFWHLGRVFTRLFSDLQQMIEKFLSFMLSLLRPLYFPEELNRLQKLHRLIGLQEDTEFISKVNLQLLTLTKLVEFECPSLTDKLARRNLSYGYTMMQYIYQAFSRNLPLSSLVQLWNSFLQQPDLLHLNALLLCVALIKHYEEDLMKVKRLGEFTRVLESQKIGRVGHLLREITALKEKYFGQVRTLIDEIKSIFNTKPLQPILFEFYRRQSARLDKRKANKQLQKKAVLRKVNRQIDIEFPQYPPRKYTLHIYFSRLPEASGSLTLHCNDVDFECLNPQTSRYFIIGEVSSKVVLNFLDLKSHDYSCELTLSQGVNEFSVLLSSPRTPTIHRVTYIAALLTDSQIQTFKRGRKFEHFLSPFVKQSDFMDELQRSTAETLFLRKYDNVSGRDDLIRKIKSLFCSGSKAFAEIEFYLEQVETSELTLEEKLELVRQLASLASHQHSLSRNQIFEKKFLYLFLDKTGYQITPAQFECFYADSLPHEFDAPKLLKCRFLPTANPHNELKLELPALNYLIDKATRYLYADIIVDDLLAALRPVIADQLGGDQEGELRLLYSTNGEVLLRAWQMKIRNKGKEVYLEEMREEAAEKGEEVEVGEPEVLMTEVLPSFAKITTILDYVNTNRNVDLKSKYQDKQRRKMAESVNVLRDCQTRLRKVLPLRFQNYPSALSLPFLHYYYDLLHTPTPPPLKNLFLNNLKSDLRAVCLFRGPLKFGENAKVQSFTYRDQIGLYGNLRLIPRESKGWFFFGYNKQDHEAAHEQARLFVNYGYGVFRWESCHVVGYAMRAKAKGSGKSSGKLKKEFLVRAKGQEKMVREYELELKAGWQDRVGPLSQQGSEEGGALKYLTKFIK